MAHNRSLVDPMGHTILIPSSIYSEEGCRNYNELKKVITSPAFLIQVGKEELYLFRLIDWELNILVQARLRENIFIVESCSQNPTAEYISQLLKRGSKFTSFK